MSNNRYADLDKLIKEYEEDTINLRSERLVMKNYPKVLTMSAASTFEYNIKNACQDFLDNPKLPIATHYPKIPRLKLPTLDSIYGKFKTLNRQTQVENLDASGFYALFGGNSFKTSAISFFNSEKAKKTSETQNIVDSLEPLFDVNDSYALAYVTADELLEQLKNASFDNAEQAFLNLKLRRNRVAHDYINGLSDTFEDIRKFYNLAVLYAISIEEAIKDLTTT